MTGLQPMTLEPLKLVHHGFVRVGLSMVERVVSIAVCQVESVEVGAARERNVDQLLRMRPGIPVHDRGVRSPLRLVHRDGAGLDEGKLRSLAGNAGLAVYGEREGLHFDGYPGDALDDVAVGLGLVHGAIRARESTCQCRARQTLVRDASRVFLLLLLLLVQTRTCARLQWRR